MLMRYRAYGLDLCEMLNMPNLKGVTEFFRVDTATAIAVVGAAVESILLPVRTTPEAYWKENARARGRVIEPLRPPQVDRRELLPFVMMKDPAASVTPMVSDARRSFYLTGPHRVVRLDC